MKQERWKSIVGFRDYKISSEGRIWSDKSNKFLKLSINSRGRLVVGLRNNKKILVSLVHRIVAVSFLGPCPEGKEVNHKDGNKFNNCVSNLEYLTPEENRKHAYEIGIFPGCIQGEKNGQSKLTKKYIMEIRNQCEGTKKSLDKLAKKYNVCWSTIWKVFNRETWAHIKPPGSAGNPTCRRNPE